MSINSYWAESSRKGYLFKGDHSIREKDGASKDEHHEIDDSGDANAKRLQHNTHSIRGVRRTCLVTNARD
jgi:hypothetical protein